MAKVILEKKFFNVEETAEILGFNPQTISGWLRKGLLPGEKMGREWVVGELALKNFVDEIHRGETILKKGSINVLKKGK